MGICHRLPADGGRSSKIVIIMCLAPSEFLKHCCRPKKKFFCLNYQALCKLTDQVESHGLAHPAPPAVWA